MIRKLVFLIFLAILLALAAWYLTRKPVEFEEPTVESVTFQEVKEDPSGLAYTINISYPQIRGLTDQAVQDRINNSIKGTVDSVTAEFRRWFADIIDSEVQSASNSELSLDGEYKVAQLTDRVLSIRMTMSDYTGGAHPNSYTLPFNYDSQTGVQLLLNDLFISGTKYEDTIFQYVWQQLSSNENTFVYISLEDLETPPLVSEEQLRQNFKLEFSNFFLTDKGLLFVFDPYQVGPYAAGFIEVVVPYGEVTSMLKPQYRR